MNASLASVISRYQASAQPRSEPVALRNAGGLSGAQLWRIDASIGPLLARRWPKNGLRREEIARIHRWIVRADRLSFVPIPLVARNNESVVESAGYCWDLYRWMPGSACLSYPPRHAQVLAGFAALAAFHRAMGEVTPGASSPGLAARLRDIDAMLSTDLTEWRSALSGAKNDPLVSSGLRWLDLAAKVAPRLQGEIRRAALRPVAIQPVIRDVRPDHLLFVGDKLTGLVDFGAMGMDAVSADLGRLIGEWFPDMADPLIHDALASYEGVRPLSPSERDLIEAFRRSADLLIGSRWVRWHFVEARRFDQPSAISDGLRRAVERIERLSKEYSWA